MTKEERWSLEGKGNDALRAARAEVKALKLAIEVHIQNLNEAAHYLTHFLSDPLNVSAHQLEHAVKLLVTDELQRKTEQLVVASKKLKALEERWADIQ